MRKKVQFTKAVSVAYDQFVKEGFVTVHEVVTYRDGDLFSHPLRIIDFRNLRERVSSGHSFWLRRAEEVVSVRYFVCTGSSEFHYKLIAKG
ncbi:MAG: hypothetical protein [Microviridae sp.]|nr:MAG: hypothetical protein [Microviridae sp.]